MLNDGRISRSPFVGRQGELQVFDDLWATQRAELVILYGRRRVGKTRMLTHWLKARQPRAIFWVAEPTSSQDQLRSFSQTVYNFENPASPALEAFSYASWRQAFEQLARLAQGQRLAVFIDEFTYLLEIEPGLAGMLQNLWDHLLGQSNLLLCLTGSHLGMMVRHVLSYQAPLYGRAGAVLKLEPLPFSATARFFPRYDPAERVTLYGMLGGIPAYWERFDPELDLEENMRRQFLSMPYLLHDEPRLLLQDFLSDPHNYVAILRAIAHNHRTPKEIGAFTGLDAKHVPAYISKLVETGFVERRLPVTAGPKSRLGRHHITDPFLRFYYRFLAQRQRQLALGVQDQALAEIQRHLPDFIGTHTWEELCRDWLLLAGSQGRLPFLPDQVGCLWARDLQIDVAGFNPMEKTLILGECKWTAEHAGREVLERLVERTEQALPGPGRWRVYYLGFSRSGWSRAAPALAKELAGSFENWDVAGAELLDLSQIARDLTQWTE